jgi:glutathione S-transferase
MAGGTLYHVPRTISSPIVQCLLELGAVGKVTVEEMEFSSLKQERYLAINPMGTSPGFQDGDIVIWESGAILDYLLVLHDPDNILHPEEQSRVQWAKYLQLKQYIIATVYPFLASLYCHARKNVEQQDTAYVKASIEKWTDVMGPVLTKWLGDGPYLLGSNFSAVDFLVAKPLNNANSMGLLEDFSELKALFCRIKSRKSFNLAYEPQLIHHGNPPSPVSARQIIDTNEGVQDGDDCGSLSLPCRSQGLSLTV